MDAARNTDQLFQAAHRMPLGHPVRTKFVLLAVEVQVRAEQRAHAERVRRELVELCREVQP